MELYELIESIIEWSIQKAIREEQDIRSETRVVEKKLNRNRVLNTDDGKMIQKKIMDLKSLLEAYRTGLIKEG